MTIVDTGIKSLGSAGGIANVSTGYYTGDGTAGAINVGVGFTPKYVKVMNITDGLAYEYFEPYSLVAGDTVTPNEDTLLTTFSTGAITLDQNSNIQTNMAFQTSTEVAYPPPGSQTPDDGTQGTVSVTYEAPVQANPKLVFFAGASGARMNVDGKKYVWMAIG